MTQSAASISPRRLCAFAAIGAIVGGVLFSPLTGPLALVPPILIFLLAATFFLALVRPSFPPSLTLKLGLLIGFSFGMTQSLVIYLSTRGEKIFTSFYILERFWMVQSLMLLAGMAFIFLHSLWQRKFLFALGFILAAFTLEMAAVHFYTFKEWFRPIYIPPRPYFLPFVLSFAYLVLFLLYRFYWLRMQRNSDRERRNSS